MKYFFFVLCLLFPAEAWLNITYTKSIKLEPAIARAQNIFIVTELPALSTVKQFTFREEIIEIKFKKYKILEVLKNTSSYMSAPGTQTPLPKFAVSDEDKQKRIFKKGDEVFAYNELDLNSAELEIRYKKDHVSKSPIIEELDSSLAPSAKDKDKILLLSSYRAFLGAFELELGQGEIKMSLLKKVKLLIGDKGIEESILLAPVKK